MGGVDVHQHLWPPSFVEALRRRRSEPFLAGRDLHLREGVYPLDLDDHRLERRLALLDGAGLDLAVVSLQPTLGLDALTRAERDELEQTWEEGVLELAAASGGRVRPLSPRLPRDGFAGVSVAASALDDLDALAPALDALRGSGFLFVHPGCGAPSPGSPPWWPALVDYPSQMQRAYLAWLTRGPERWPDVRVVFAILAGGAPIQLERLGSRGAALAPGAHDGVFLDTASYGPRALRLCAEALGGDRLVLGTDVPVVPPEHAVTALAGLDAEIASLARERTPRLLLD